MSAEIAPNPDTVSPCCSGTEAELCACCAFPWMASYTHDQLRDVIETARGVADDALHRMDAAAAYIGRMVRP
ncbi:MAG: hypothetical protein P1P84_02560 [Deferrisomatales bacterium]|nr:hypothetical protein [Deferrisomatales bacterium]